MLLDKDLRVPLYIGLEPLDDDVTEDRVQLMIGRPMSEPHNTMFVHLSKIITPSKVVESYLGYLVQALRAWLGDGQPAVAEVMAFGTLAGKEGWVSHNRSRFMVVQRHSHRT